VALVLVALAFTTLQAQPPAATRAPAGNPPAAPGAGSPGAGLSNCGIAVIDVTFILDRYAKLKQAAEAFKRDLQAADEKLKGERDAMVKRGERLKGLKPNTPEFKQLEEELVKAESDFKLKVGRQKNEFAEREANNYLTAYRELTQQVKVYADRHNIQLVLRFNGAPVDPANRDAVQADVLKMVMYHHPDIDITDQILAEMNRGAAVASPQRRPGQASPPR